MQWRGGSLASLKSDLADYSFEVSALEETRSCVFNMLD